MKETPGVMLRYTPNIMGNRGNLLGAWALAILLGPLGGCASLTGKTAPTAPTAPLEQGAAAGWLRVAMQAHSPVDEQVVWRSGALAMEAAQRWGTLRYPVTVKVHPSHAALEVAAHQHNVPWMRGWARFDEIELEAPSKWGGDRAPQNVTELLSHELTHVVMYQRVSDLEAWTHVDIPLWFREGMASVTSAQGYRRMTPAQLGAWLRAHPGQDPWQGADALAHAAQPVVYGAAHRAFERMVAGPTGDAPVAALLDAMHDGAAFEEAFGKAMGASSAEFLAAFQRDLVGGHGAQHAELSSVTFVERP